MKQLVKIDACWADEFNVEAFTVWDLEETQRYFEVAQILFDLLDGKEFEVGFGTNESLTFYDYKDFRNCFSVTNLEDSEAQVLQKHFPQYDPQSPPEFGTGSRIFDFNTLYDQIFNFYDEGNLLENVINQLKRIEPEFEKWLSLDT
jgi:hypothetical protein